MDHSKTEQEILRLAQERSAALVRKDVAALERLLADTFRYINASGATLDKAEYLREYVAAPEVVWASQELDEARVDLYGEAAVLTCRVHDRARFGDQRFEGHFRSTFVWVRQAGAWRCAAGHTTAIAPSDESE